MNKQSTNTPIDLLVASALGAVVALIVTMIISSLGASLMTTERVGEDSAGIISVIMLITSSFVGAEVAIVKAGHHRLAVCLAAGVSYLIILLACNALLFDGKYQAVGTTALAVLGGSGCAALLGLRGRQVKSRHSKYHNMKLVQNRQMGN